MFLTVLPSQKKHIHEFKRNPLTRLKFWFLTTSVKNVQSVEVPQSIMSDHKIVSLRLILSRTNQGMDIGNLIIVFILFYAKYIAQTEQVSCNLIATITH